LSSGRARQLQPRDSYLRDLMILLTARDVCFDAEIPGRRNRAKDCISDARCHPEPTPALRDRGLLTDGLVNTVSDTRWFAIMTLKGNNNLS
jgi:hypothetical protein